MSTLLAVNSFISIIPCSWSIPCKATAPHGFISIFFPWFCVPCKGTEHWSGTSAGSDFCQNYCFRQPLWEREGVFPALGTQTPPGCPSLPQPHLATSKDCAFCSFALSWAPGPERLKEELFGKVAGERENRDLLLFTVNQAIAMTFIQLLHQAQALWVWWELFNNVKIRESSRTGGNTRAPPLYLFTSTALWKPCWYQIIFWYMLETVWSWVLKSP